MAYVSMFVVVLDIDRGRIERPVSSGRRSVDSIYSARGGSGDHVDGRLLPSSARAAERQPKVYYR